MENLLVGAIVILAVYYFVRGLYRNFKADEKSSCGCSCSGECSQISTCEEPPRIETES